MAYSPTELLTVYLDARNQRRKVGRLAFKDRQVFSSMTPHSSLQTSRFRRSNFPSGLA